MGPVNRPPRRGGDDPRDADLLLRVRAGDRGAVDDLYARFSRPAFALARRILGDDALAEDVLQEVFLGVWRDPWAYHRDRGSFPAWLMALVHHQAVDAVRREEAHRRRRGRVVDDLTLAAPTSTREVEDDVWARAVLGALPTAQREALTLAYYGGYTQREVAALTHTALGTVKTRMLAGMRRLREELGGTSLGGALGGAARVEGPSR
jgi:RNA polymerase sigma factor (sigma-70 family)